MPDPLSKGHFPSLTLNTFDPLISKNLSICLTIFDNRVSRALRGTEFQRFTSTALHLLQVCPSVDMKTRPVHNLPDAAVSPRPDIRTQPIQNLRSDETTLAEAFTGFPFNICCSTGCDLPPFFASVITDPCHEKSYFSDGTYNRIHFSLSIGLAALFIRFLLAD